MLNFADYSAHGNQKGLRIMKNLSSHLSRLLSFFAVILLAGCQSSGFGPQFSATLEGSEDITLPSTRQQNVILAEEGTDLSRNIAAQQQFAFDQEGLIQQPPESQVYRGTGRFVTNIKPRKQPETSDKAAQGDITLNFENTDLREVVKVILGDTLKVNYILDPAVRGGVTMQTGAPRSREDLIPTLETRVRTNPFSLPTPWSMT